jgi:hypothetical protein
VLRPLADDGCVEAAVFSARRPKESFFPLVMSRRVLMLDEEAIRTSTMIVSAISGR